MQGNPPVVNRAARDYLAQRLNPIHLSQRLGMEADHEADIFGQGRTLFHPENWFSLHRFIRRTLQLVHLHARGKRNALAIQLRHNSIHFPHLPLAFSGFRILHLSDLHLDMAPELPTALHQAVTQADYDICVLTGDFRFRTHGSLQPALEAMAELCSVITTPIYGVLGNHDSIRMLPALERMGIRMLMNESIPLKRQGAIIYLAGVDDPHYYQADNLEQTCRELPPEALSILLAHSPEIYRRATHAGFDLMLCGHTHGGQVRLPGNIPLTLNARCPRHLGAGQWQHHQMQGYTSTGAGSSIVDVRFNCPPEITVHRLLSP